MKKDEFLEAINGLESVGNNTSFTFCLESIITGFDKSDSSVGPDDYLNEHFDDLLNSVSSIRIEAIPYSEVTRIVFDLPDESEALDALLPSLIRLISDKVRQLQTENVPNSYVILIKVYEHLELANKQLASLYKQQKDEINKANKNLKKTTIALDFLKKDINEKADVIDDIEIKFSKITIDFVTILGIFTSITFATFGGLQLLGNVFGNIKFRNYSSVGYTLILSAAFLLCIYAILISLFKGLAIFTSRDYKINNNSLWFLIGTLLVLCAAGFILSLF